MISGNKNIEYEILNNLDDKSLVNYCQLNKESRKICEDDYFWLSRIVNRFPYLDLEILRKYKRGRTWSQYYINNLRIFVDEDIKYDPNMLLLTSGARGRLDHVIIALNNGADINDQYSGGLTALIMASGTGQLKVVKYLIKNGADINRQSDNGTTALMMASQKGHLDIVKFLIKNGANINHQNNKGKTALMGARYYGHLKVVKYLIKEGAK